MLQYNKFCHIITESNIDFQEALCVDICINKLTFKTVVVYNHHSRKKLK